MSFHLLLINWLNNSLQWYIEHGYLPDPNAEYIYLYNNGNENTVFTGGWTNISSYTELNVTSSVPSMITKGVESKESTYLYFGGNSTGTDKYYYGGFKTIDNVNLSSYSKLKINADLTGNGDGKFVICLYDGINYQEIYTNTSYVSGENIIDISAYTGKYQVIVGAYFGYGATTILTKLYSMQLTN